MIALGRHPDCEIRLFLNTIQYRVTVYNFPSQTVYAFAELLIPTKKSGTGSYKNGVILFYSPNTIWLYIVGAFFCLVTYSCLTSYCNCAILKP